MEIERKDFIKRLDGILGSVKTLETTCKEEPEKLSTEDIKDLTDIIKSKLSDTINYLKTE